MNWQEKHTEEVKSLHARKPRVTEAEKLKVLRTWKHWRGLGYEVQVLAKRLRTSTGTVKKWAQELNFDLGGTR